MAGNLGHLGVSLAAQLCFLSDALATFGAREKYQFQTGHFGSPG